MKQRCVLIVEDDPDVGDVLAEMLVDDGYAVETTESAFGVAELVRRLRPDAIVLDLGLPYRSGDALLVDLKADTRTRHIPVVIVSGLVDALPAERRSLAAAVLSKPLRRQVFLDTLRAACIPAN